MVAVCQSHSRAKSTSSRRAELLFALLLLCCQSAALQAQDVYKNVDAAGHVSYSDQPDLSPPQSSPNPTNDTSFASELYTTPSPPPLPDSEQLPCPEDGDLWVPGYWAWDGTAYNWVPGAWVAPPRVGVLWTPGYWAFVDSRYVFHRGYWSPHVGYYGGINYGYGYGGAGYVGGRWVGNTFAYNRAVTNVNADIVHHFYSEAVAHQGNFDRVSYNGGPGGTSAVPTAQEKLTATQQRWQQPQQSQRIHIQTSAAAPTPKLRAETTHPAPALAYAQTAADAPRAVSTRRSPVLPVASNAKSAQPAVKASARPPVAARRPNPPRTTLTMSTGALHLTK